MKYLILVISLIFAGCSGPAKISTDLDYHKSHEYQSRQKLSGSFFKKSGDNFSEEAIKKLLNSKIEIAKSVKVAMVQLDSLGQYKNPGYLNNDENMGFKNSKKFFQEIVDSNRRVKDISMIPSFLLPHPVTIASLRDAAALIQANLLLIVKMNGRTDFKLKFFSEDKAMAKMNMEVAIVDVSTGAIPYTGLISGEKKVSKISEVDFNRFNFEKRARKEALDQVYGELSKDLNQLFKSKTL